MHALTSATTGDLPVALIADYDDDTRAMYATYLQHAGFHVHEAHDGREALAKAITERPAIIVTETRLPGIDGFDLCRLLRADMSTRATPILVVTGDALPGDLARARTAGADQVCVKPCLPDAMLAEMRRLIAVSRDLRNRSEAARARAGDRLARSNEVLARAMNTRRPTLSRSHLRGRTTTPPLEPPTPRCPRCDLALAYEYSHLGGVSEKHSEQWDYFACPAACGTFQYRHRTRKLRKV
jgi:DNA-binding response OmpR family regulator